MAPSPPKLPRIKLSASPLKTLREVINDSHQQIEKAGSGIRSLADGIASKTTAERQPPTNVSESQKELPSPQSATYSTSSGKLTNEDILAHQNREIGTELWLLEKHLAQGCRIPDKTGKRIPCDCCAKGSFIAGLTYESIPIAERGGKPSAVYEKIARWANEMEPLVTVPAIETGKYDYKKLAGQASALRKELMGTLALGALLSPAARREIADRASKIVEEEVV